MKLIIGAIITALSIQSVGAISSPYEYEQYEAKKYATRLRTQARELDKLADRAEHYYHQNQKALEQAQRQELAFSKMKHAQDGVAKAKVFITEYPDYIYDIAVSEKQTQAVIK